MTIHSVAAYTAIALFLYFATVQILVACGLIPVSILWGGSHDSLTPSLRVASLAAVGVLLGMAYIIYRRMIPVNDSSTSPPSKPIRILSWAVTAYIAINCVGNFLSNNPFERYVSGALTVITAGACAIVSSAPVHDDGYENLNDG
mmetsp:Transcript_4527/g.9611  ORF Transcript_4527/g.9611 Transcript_4527/m.9611 type:complete len:145 (+) Transcript_4527:154-588(+)